MLEKLRLKPMASQAVRASAFKEPLPGRWLFCNLLMQKFIILFLVSLLPLVSLQAQTYTSTPINLTGFNYDLVANGTGHSNTSSNSAVDGINASENWTFMSSDFVNSVGAKPASGFGLPANGTINSATTSGLTFQLASYSGNNALRIEPAVSGTPGSGTLIFTTPQTADQVCLLIASGYPIAAGAAIYTVTFTDATTQAFTGGALPNWYNGSGYAIQGIGRVSRNTDVIENPSGNPRIYQYILALSAGNTTKQIQSITFTNADASHFYHVMGVTTRTALQNDAGVASITAPTSPVTPGVSVPVTVTVKNYGASPLTSATLGFSVDGSTVVNNYAFTDATGLATNAVSSPVTIGNFIFSAGTRKIKAWTSLPNGTTDGTASNDTTVVTLIACNSLNGTYTIDKSSPASATNFTSFALAQTALTSCGISGPVTFNVVAGTGPYNEQVVLPAITGASATNTITFNGNGNILSNPATTGDALQLNGAKYFLFNNLKVAAGSSATSGAVVSLIGGAQSNTFSGCTFTNSITTTSNTMPVVNLATGSSSNTFQNNTFIGGYYGIYNSGASATQNNNNQFIGNTIKDPYFYGIYNYYSPGTLIEGNDISRPTRTNGGSFYGVYNTTNGTGVTISKNRIHNTHDAATSTTGTVYGIYSVVAGTLGAENIIKNNALYNINNSGGSFYAFYNSSGNNTYYYHNTVSADNASINYSSIRGMWFQSASTNVRFINNNISLSSPATNKHAIYLSSTTIALVSNNNNLYVGSSGNIGYYNGNQATLANWKAVNANAYDQASVSADPIFVNAATGNLQPRSASVDNKGQALAAVTDDITGASRPATPDPGAYEFTSPPPAPYTWNGSVSTDYTDPLNWTPNRNTPDINDILTFNNGLSNVTNVPTETIGQLLITNNTTVKLQSAVTATLTIGGGTGDDLTVPSGCTLQLDNPSASAPILTIAFAGATPVSTGTIDGNLILSGDGTDTPGNYKNVFNPANAIVTVNGTVESAGSVAGSASTLIFNSGSKYNHNFTTAYGGVPGATWNPGSLVTIKGFTTFNATLSGLGQTFADFTWNCPNQDATSMPIINAPSMVVNGTFTLQNTGAGSLKISQASGITTTCTNFVQNGGILDLSGGSVNGILKVTGSFTQNGGTITETGTSTASGILFNGTTNQAVTFAANGVTNSVNYNLNNLGGMTLLAPMKVNDGATLTLTAGLLKLGNYDLAIGSTGSISVTTPSTSKMIVINGTGQLKKTFAASATTIFNFPVGEETGSTEYSPVSLSLTNGTTVRTIGVSVTNATPPNLNAGGTATDYLNRFWTFSDDQAVTGTYNYTGTFTYTTADVVSSDANMKASRYDGSTWTQTISNAGSNVLTLTTALSELTGALGGSVFSGRSLAASTFTWTGGSITSPSNWFDASNWDLNSIPGISDNVVINNASVTQPVISSIGSPVAINNLNLTAGSLTLDANSSITVSGIFTYAAPANAFFDCSSTFTYASTSAQTIQALSYGNLVSQGGTAGRTFESGKTTTICGSFTNGSNIYTTTGSIIDFSGTGAQTIPAITYNDLTISGSRGANNVTLPNSTITIGGSFTAPATFTTGTFVPGTSTVVLNNATSQTIPAIQYYNLTASGGPRTISGTVKIAGTFTPGTGTYTTTGSTVEFNGTGGTTAAPLPIPALIGNYNKVTISGTGNFGFSGTTVTIDGDYTQSAGTVAVAWGTSGLAKTINMNGDFNISGGAFNLVNSSTASSYNRVYVGTTGSPKNLNITGSGSINLEAIASASTAGQITVSGDFNSNTTAANAIDFGTGTGLGANALFLGGNLNMSGNGKFYTSGSNSSGVFFAKAGSQTVNSSVTHQKTIFTVNTGSTVVLAADLNMSGTITPANQFIVNGTLDMAEKTITGGGTNNSFIVNAGGVVKTSYATGLNDAVTSFATRTFNTGADLELYGTSAIAQTTFPTAVRNLTVSNTNIVTLGSNVAVSGALTTNAAGTLDLGTNQITGAGTVTIGGTLKTAHASGLSSALANTGTTTLGPASTIEYNGTGAQTISARPDYQNLNISGARSGAITLESGTIGIAQDFIKTAIPTNWTTTGNTVEFKGTAQEIPAFSFNDLKITGTATDDKLLLDDISVAGTLTMNGGKLLTSSVKKVNLNATATLVETSTSYVTGNVETAAINMNTSGSTYTFNGIGLALSPQGTNLPGLTSVRRVTGTPLSGNGNQGIGRYYEISAANNSNLDVTMVFGYQDHELNGIQEGNLVFFKSVNGTSGPWSPQDQTSIARNAALNTVSMSGVTGFSVWTLADGNAPLPVELVSFEAKKVGTNAELIWLTASEHNSQGFEVQVSANGKDFRKLGFVESRNGNSMQQYRFTDAENGKTGIRYYRLKQIDFDGKVTYYAVKAVRFETEKLQLSAYPNPFQNEVNLAVAAADAGKATLKLIDLSGKTVFEQEVSVQKGNNKLTIGLDKHLPAGVYVLQAQFGSELITTRLLKK